MQPLIAFARSVGSGNSIAMIASTTDDAAAAPTPWMNRTAISTGAD